MEDCHFQISIAFSEDFINICWHAKQNSLKNRIFWSILSSSLGLNVSSKLSDYLAWLFVLKKQGELKKKLVVKLGRYAVILIMRTPSSSIAASGNN